GLRHNNGDRLIVVMNLVVLQCGNPFLGRWRLLCGVRRHDRDHARQAPDIVIIHTLDTSASDRALNKDRIRKVRNVEFRRVLCSARNLRATIKTNEWKPYRAHDNPPATLKARTIASRAISTLNPLNAYGCAF